MNWFTKPKRVETGNVVVSIVGVLALCFFMPAHKFESSVSWVFGFVIAFPVGFVAGWFANNFDSAFYIRGCLAMIAGAVAWPLCLVFRPVAADFAFVVFAFGAGPVAAHRFLHRNHKRDK